MAYGHTIKKRNSKKNRAATRQLEPRVVLASLAMAAGIFAYPFGVGEAAIVRENNTVLDAEGNVHNIAPEGRNGDLAYNRFKEFNLERGHIANLLFGDNATALANLVNSRISIDGIVNGIKGGQIDGHLIFLSPDGIAVGAHGVINAGQFTGIVPTRTAFETLYNAENTITLDAINKLAYANDKTIDVKGKINTHSGVMLGAGIININDGAKIESTKNLDFKTLVNIEGGASAGLSNLSASSGEGGDIVLTARQTSDVKDTKTVTDNGQEKTEANPIRWGDRSTDLSAAVNIGKGVTITNSDGAVKLTAESKSTYEDNTPMTLTQTLKGIVLGDENTLLDGVINKLANKEAANNKYLFVNYSSKKNKSSVNVGEGSTITGNTIDIAANSTVEIKQSVVAAVGKKDSEGNASDGSKAIAAVAVSRVYNSADVVIDGKLEATGEDTTKDGTKISALQIAANADTKAALSATGNGGDGNAVAVGVAVLTGDTKSKVTVNAPELKADKGKVSIDATTKSDVDITVNAVGQNSYVVSNVGMANYDTNADVTVNGTIQAGAVDVNAGNTITGLKMTVDNIVQKPSQSGGDAGKDAPEASAAEKEQDEEAANAEKDKPKSEDEKNSEGKSIDPTKVLKEANVDPKTDDKTKDAAGSDDKGGVQDVKDKLEGSNDGGDNANKNSAFGLGTAVGVFLNENNANVTLGKNAAITATKVENSETANGAVNISAKTTMVASADDSLALSVKNAQSGANVEIGAAVLVSNVKNNATVLMDNEGNQSAQIMTNGTVALDASVSMAKYTVTEKTKDENGQEKEEAVEKTSTLTYAVSAEGKAGEETPSTVALDGSVGINTLKNNAIVLLGQNSKVEGSSVKLSSDATTNAEGTYGATDENSKVAVGGTVGLQNIRGNSLVMTGKGAEIKGTDSFEASAENSMDLKNSVKNAGKGDSIGISGMLALSYGDSNSVVSLDDEANITTGFATITSTNSTNIENSAQSESTSVGKAFGIGVGIVNYDVNSLAMVGDNGSGITAPSGTATTDKDKAAKKIAEDAILARSIAGDTLVGKLGTMTADNATKGSITAGGLIGAAVTTGMIQNDAKAKAAPEADEKEGDKKDSEKWTQWSKQGEEGAGDAKKNVKELEEDTLKSKNDPAAPSASEAMGEASRAANPDGTTDESAAPTAAGSETSAGASIGIEGSAALTFLGGRTDAVLDNVTVKNGTEAEPAPVAAVSLSATDFLGSITMGGTSIKQEGEGPQVGIGGTFAMNKSNRDVDSLIRNSELPMALMVSNSATKIGIEVAAGMGTSTGSGDGVTVSGAGGVYYNKANQDIHALMIDNTVMGASVSNQATGTDFQIAGGLAATKGDGTGVNVGVGGAVAISNLENNLASGIVGGNYTVLSSVDVEAQKGTTQISGAVAGTKGGYGFEGAFAYGSVKNTTHAYISDDANITASGNVNVKAGEVPVVTTNEKLAEEKTTINSKIDSSLGADPTTIDTTKNYTVDAGKTESVKTELKKQTNAALDKEKKAQDDHKKTLDDMGLDTTGKSYLDTSENAQSSVKEEFDDNGIKTDGEKIADDAASDENAAKGDLGQNRSLTITAAMGGGYNDSVGVAAGIAYNYVKNDIAADIKGSTITADAVNGEASSDATIVSVGAGATIGGKTFNGAGSGSWNDLKNDTTVTFENNTITGKSVSEQANNSASIINIAGELVGGKGMAMGLSLAYNSMNNTTGTYLTNNKLKLQSDGDAPGAVTLSAANTGKALAVAGGVNVNITQAAVGATGTVAINRGVNHTESVIDNADNTISDVKELSVTASELTKKTTVAGGVSVGGKKVGLGGSVAYTSVGSSKDKERLRAEINHANITTTSDGTITVSTTDSKQEGNNEPEKSRVITVGAGVGVDWGKNFFNLQGGAAVSDIYKDSHASLNNTNINENTEDNQTNADKHPTINVTADTKSKINTVGVGGSVSIGSQVKGAAGVAINRMYQDTKAEMATDDGKTTTVNAGLTEVRATGDGDIHSVGVGGLVGVGGQVAFAGSGSYNYIGNNVNAILKNQALTSNSSVGVVAQSDDRLYNFAGGFAIGANTKVGLGAAVGINKITGSTNALISGGSVAAADTGTITVSRPKDDDLFKAEKLDVSTNRQKLSENREEKTKTGIVVDSSATHTMISQLSSGGVAISGSVGVNVDGTVNLNTIEGGTTAKIQDAKLNTADTASNVNVNAIDYANLGTFTGTPSIGGGGVGVSVGVSANWETLDRRTEAEISSSSASDKKNVYAKDLTVDATAKHGSSALSFAAAGAAGKVSVSSGDSIMRHKYTNQTLAKLSNVNAVFDGAAEIKADHLGNSHTENVAVSASVGMVAVAAGAGVSVMDDSSVVKAEVENSELKEKAKATAEDGSDKKTIDVSANNKNTWKHTLVTANLAVGIGAGVAANVGINNTTGETAALVTNSDLEATDVTVKATEELTGTGTGGVGAGGVGGVGVAVALNNLNSSVSAHVTGGSVKASNVKASNNIEVAAEEKRDFSNEVTGAAAGGIGVGVNVAVTSINKGITDAQLSNAKDENGDTGVGTTTQNEISKHLASVNGAKGALGVSGVKLLGLSATDSDLAAAKNVQVSLATPSTKTQGVHTSVSSASLTADNNVNVKATDTSDIFAKNVGVTAAGAASVNVTDNIIHTNYDTDVTMKDAAVTGKNVNISALQTQGEAREGKQGSDVRVTAVTVGALGGVGVGYAGIVNKSATDVNISDSTVKATENVTVGATDASKHNSQILSVGVAALNVTTTFASLENASNVGVTLGGTNNISAGKNITIDAKKANTLNAHTQGVGVGGVNVAVNHATIEDKGNATAKITETTNITGADANSAAEKFHFGAANDTTAKLSAGNTTVSVLGVSRMRGKGVMDMGADVSVAGGSFNAKTVEFASSLGTATGRTLEGNVKGHNISAVAVAPDAVILDTTATSNINVANSTFGENTDLVLANQSYVDRKAYIYDVTAGAVAVGNTSADIYGKETMNTSLTGKSGITSKLASMEIVTYGENKGKAFADAGGGSLVGYIGAHVANESTNNVTSSLGGKWNVAGGLSLIAAQKDETRLTASEGHGGVIGVGGTSVDNTITTTTDAKVADDMEITANRVHIGTSNTLVTGAYDDTNANGVDDVQTYTLKDHFGGVISGNRLRSLLNVTENGTVTVGTNAKITTNKLQEYIAASQNNLTNDVQAKGGGAVVVTDAVTENKIYTHNTVDVKSGATLSNEKAASTEDIILSAYDNQTLKAHSDATVLAGVVSPLVATNETTMDRVNAVNVAGTIESGSNVNLYAGTDEKGAKSNLNVDLKAGAYNYSVIPITSPTVNYTLNADKGTVNVSGTVRSTKDINAFADVGRESIVKDETKWAWVTGGKTINKKFLSSDAVTAEESLPKTSSVTVTGSLIAGTADPINVTIDGSVAGGLTITADDNDANKRVIKGVTQGTFDYANTLGERLAELNKLIASYDGKTGNADAMAAYIAERDRIQQEMEKRGLTAKDANGTTIYVNSGRPVYYVEIPDIATSGGNINVRTNDLAGTGNLHANSAPAVTITNNSDAYMKLNNILMGEQGGSINYGETVIPPGRDAGNAKINELNVSSGKANFREIYGRTEATAPDLKVLNTKKFSGDKTSTITLNSQLAKEIESSDLTQAEKDQVKKDINDGKMTYTAITDVEVNGKISNFYGQVEINNASGDIRISGGTQDRPTGVFGNTVKLIAGNGSIAQDYKEGIVNINGDPEKYLVDLANTMKTDLKLSETENDKKDKTSDYQRSDSSNTATGYIAGRDVYVSASNVNVNGLIQSGYKNYTATVTQDDLDVAKGRPASRAAIVQNRTMYKVNEGGAQWNENEKVFDYVPQVYWDPSTDQLFVEDIDTAGGKIYLTGKIASTGQGRILAADGAALITVENQTALDMNVGSVLNNQREGVITIADTAKDTWTEYRRGQTRTITGYAQYLAAHAKDDGDIYAGAGKSNNDLDVGKTLSYGVKENQTYSWVNGNSVETTLTYEHYVRKGLWGAIETVNDTGLKGLERESKVIDKSDAKKLGLPEGAVINQESASVPADGKLQLNGTTTLLESKIFGREHDEWSSGFLGWFKHSRDRWKDGRSTIQLYNFTLNASQPITVGLIGDATGKIDIKSTNTGSGSINLTGNVANSHNAATLSVSSAAGGIAQFDNTTLKSEIVTLTAKNDIKNIHLTSIGSIEKDAEGNIVKDDKGNPVVTDNIQLTAVSNGKGDIDVTAVGGVLENNTLPGNVEIVSLKSLDGNNFDKNEGLGDVTLTANGNITQSGSDTTVTGRGITLASKNGGIGTAEKAIQIAGSDLVYSTDRYGAQVNASAQKDIYLTEASEGGDMRVGKIESKTGDVTLTVKDGAFIDGLPGNDKSGSTDSVDEMVHRWIDAGLIAGEGNYVGAYVEGLRKNRDDYEANVRAAYDSKTQAQWQTEYNDQKPAVEAIYASAEYRTYLANKKKYDELTQDQRKALADSGDSDFAAYAKSGEQYSQYAKYATADEYLKDTAAYKYSQHANADDYLANDATYTDLKNQAENPTYEWTKEMMLYAVSDKMVNPENGGSAQTDRAANVLGKNVTLASTKGAVGSVSDQVETIEIAALDNENTNHIENMKKLMNAGASDVTAVRNDDGDLTEFQIRANMPLGVNATGTLDVQAGGNVSVAGRKNEAGDYSAMNVKNIDATQNGATGDVRLYSEKGITNALEDANGINIKGNNLIVTGGTESIGTAEKPLTVSLAQNTGDLVEARAEKNVFIKNMNSSDYLRLGAMFAKDTISLASEKGFLMSNANSGIAESYINAGKKLEFNTNETTGIVGNEERAIRILNDRAPVNIAAKSAYIKGMKDGTLVLGTVDTKDEFVAESEGSLTVGREEEKNSAGTVVKTAVEGRVNAGGDATLIAADDLTLDGTVQAGDLESAKKTLTLTATNGSITQTDKGAITADAVNTFNGKSLLLENTENKFNSLTVDSGSESDIAGDVRVRDNSDALTVKINQKTAGDISVQNLRADGTLKNVGNLTATGNISLGAKGNLTQAANTALTAGKDVTLASASGSVAQETGNTTGIAAQKVTAISAKDVDLQGAGNAFSVLTVDSSTENTPIAGSVSVSDSADKLTLSVNPAVNGNITVENTKAQGTLNAISELRANGNEAENAKGDISLKSDGTMQTDKTMAAKGDVKLTATHGDVAINGNISTGALTPPDSPFTPGGETPYNYLSVTAGGAVKEAAGVKIDTPVVQTFTGKDVFMESENNTFSAFFAKGLDGADAINGSVKVVTNFCNPNTDTKTVTVGIGAAINGDAAFTNLHADGNLGILSWRPGVLTTDTIKVNGGNGAKGDLALTASQDVMLINNVDAAHDILIENTGGGSFYGIGYGMKAGNDVSVSAGDKIFYIGATVEAGHDISMETKSTSTSDSGIYIGNKGHLESLPQGLTFTEDFGASTTIQAGNDASFTVKGNGDIVLLGHIEAENGQVVANISQKGDITVGHVNQTDSNTITAKKDVALKTNEGYIALVKSIESTGESVTVETGKGDIVIGLDNVPNDETVKANKNATIGTDLGTVTIRGKTSTVNGDITMKAGQDTYQADEWSDDGKRIQHGNFIIEDDGKVISGGGITLNGRNGDILITDDIDAKKGLTVNIAGEGDVGFGTKVDVTKDVDIATDKGDITVGNSVTSQEGAIRLQSGSGNILVGQDVTAGNNVVISSQQGNIEIGDSDTGEGDVLSKTGNVSIETGKGNVEISRTVTAQEGSIGISSGQGDILIGNNGPDVKTVTAKQNLDLAAADGKIVVYGKTSTEVGDISLSAHRKAYVPGGDNRSFIIDQNGKLEAGGKLRLDVGEGDLHVSDRLQSNEDLVAEVSGKGSVYFDTNVNVNGNVSIKTDEGDIHVGHEVQATKNIGMTTSTGNIDIGKAITSTGGSIGVNVGTGNVTIGDNGPDVETVTAKDSINMAVDLGKIIINGKTSTQTGDIAMSAGDSHYTPGVQNIVIGLNGQVDSGRDVNLQGRNGDLHVTDAIQVKRDLYGQVTSGGGVFFEQSATLPGDLVLSGNFIVADSVNATTNGTVFNFTATGAIPDKLITEDFYVGSLKSKYGTEVPSLWTNRGYLHVDEGDTTLDDALAVDKIYMDNEPTNLAIFGRTPTRDGEQLVYWNNLDMANDKTRSFQLYTDGTLRTHGAVLIDAERYYTKLYGDNLSVVDMMRDRVTHERGEYTFDSKTLTEPGRLVREPVFFGMESTDVVIQQRNATDAEIVVES